jgi:hypothetical protein
MKHTLSNLSSALLTFHRELLFFQTALVEKSDNLKYTPYDLLKLSLNDPRFSWLRKFSELIIQIDIITDDKKNTPYDAHAILATTKNLISTDNTENSDFKFALRSDSALMVSLGAVRKALSELENALKSEAN